MRLDREVAESTDSVAERFTLLAMPDICRNVRPTRTKNVIAKYSAFVCDPIGPIARHRPRLLKMSLRWLEHQSWPPFGRAFDTVIPSMFFIVPTQVVNNLCAALRPSWRAGAYLHDLFRKKTAFEMFSAALVRHLTSRCCLYPCASGALAP